MQRRQFLTLLAGAAAVPGFGIAAKAAGLESAVLRGSLGVSSTLVQPVAFDATSQTLQEAIDAAAAEDRTLFLPAGTYEVSNLTLPRRARLTGIPGGTRLVYTGAGHLIVSGETEFVRLTDLVFDGANRPFADYVPGLVHLSGVPDIGISGCQFVGSAGSALAIDRCGGRVTGNDISGAAEAGIRAIESTGLSVSDNIVRDCGNNGILIHRWSPGEDGSIVIGNRVERIRADAGGTGPYGNGINVFQAHNVLVAQNRIADCAFTAVRANGADNVQILGNNCSRLGEVAIFSEFAFEAAVIANNIVEEAATGISVANFNDGGRIATVTGNVVRNVTGEGPYPVEAPGFGVGISVEADAVVTGNVIEGAPLAGMWLGWGPFLRDVAVTGNVIRDSAIGISVSVVEGVGAVSITDNLIHGYSEGAVLGTAWSERVTGDLAQPGSPRVQGLNVSGNLVAR